MTTPLHYKLFLDPRPAEGTFSGSVAIDITRDDASDPIVLDCAGLEILSVMADGAPARFERQTEHLVIEARTASTIAIDFSGVMSAGRGVYTTGEFTVAQLQPQYARRLFPCFDEPHQKATFDVTISADRADVVVFNTTAVAEQMTGERRVITFARTAPMPPHMLALAIGPFQVTESACDGVPVRFFTRAADGREAFALDVAVAALRFLQRWLNAPYPFAKLDLVAVPRLEVAAMENSGGILFRESAVLIEEVATESDRRNVAHLVAHEVSHQWFGSLVTPAEWKDLWLSEGFATWLAPRAMAAIAPQLASPLMEARALRSAMPAELQSAFSDVRELFDAAAYQKAAALLRMLEAWLGEDSFRAGVQRYVADHANGTVAAGDLWRSLGAGVANIAAPLIAEGGVPRLTFDWSDNVVRIAQAETLHSVPLFIKVHFQGGSTEIHRLLLQTPSAERQLGANVAWVFGNANASGYYRSAHARLRAIPIEQLTPEEAFTLLDDLWDAVWRGEIDILAYLGTAADARDPVFVAGHFAELRELLAGGARLPLFDRWIAARGLTTSRDEPPAGDDYAAMLIDPATRDEAWARLKANWDEVRGDAIGFGGHGAITALGVVSDRAIRDDIAAFFAGRELPGAQRALHQTLAKIDARIHFRAQQQPLFDAWLARQSVPSVVVTEDLRAAHALLNALCAVAEGLQVARNFRRGDVAALQAARSAVESRFLQLFAGNAAIDSALLDRAAWLREELLAAASSVETALAAGDSDAAATLATFLVGHEAMRDRFVRGMIAFADLFDRPEEADTWRARPAAMARAAAETRALAIRALSGEDGAGFRETVFKEGARLPAALRSLANDLAGVPVK